MNKVVPFPAKEKTSKEVADTYTYHQLLFLPDDCFFTVSRITAVSEDGKYFFGVLLFIENCATDNFSYYLFDPEHNAFGLFHRFHAGETSYKLRHSATMQRITDKYRTLGEVTVDDQYATAQATWVETQ